MSGYKALSIHTEFGRRDYDCNLTMYLMLGHVTFVLHFPKEVKLIIEIFYANWTLLLSFLSKLKSHLMEATLESLAIKVE